MTYTIDFLFNIFVMSDMKLLWVTFVCWSVGRSVGQSVSRSINILTFCFLQRPKMFLIDNTEHINLLIEVIKDLENVEQNVCLKTKDGEKFYVNQVLLSIVFPYLGNILDGDGSESVVFVVPLEMRMLRMVLDIKLRGFVNINDQEDIWRIIQAFDILGEKIGADQIVKHRVLSGDCPISDIKDLI